ncbi:LuxR family transcriptional regulator [Kitasatospora cathayae]|uniref:LuxR family transcriptional regulator n=1 Tax=Kitasatospora cathayae TaxID=3004092 RepID=A0ABY7QCP6_9ACTN|nr:LuxR family transcriptional regulator [Kitasatospora sp. HUAS 3-15]WBP90382.1 LuxR family transcriptional regulator [Kitasatospora sp. HUAS 3-15]
MPRAVIPDQGSILGRTSELAALSGHAGSGRRGNAGCVVLTGPAGIGKTRLLAELRAESIRHGALVLHGERPDRAGYSGLRALFAGAGTVPGDADASVGAALAAHLPDRQESRAFDPAEACPVFHGLYRAAARVMTDRPLVLILDDGEACDEHTLRWLDFLLRRSAGLPLLVALTRRDGARPAAPAAWIDLTADPFVSPLPLAPLDRAAVAGLVGRWSPAPAEPAFVDHLVEVCGGNPRTTLHILDELGALGHGPDGAGADRLAELGARTRARAVRTALDAACATVRAAAAAVAVLGTARTDLVAGLAGVPEHRADETVVMLGECGALTADGDVHPAARTALLASGDGLRTAELHAKAALLLSDAGRPAEQVARHLMEVPGIPQPWMAVVLCDAATAAERGGAFALAADYLHRALDTTPEDHRLRLRLAVALAQTDPLAAVPVFRAALALAAEPADRARIAVECAMACLAVPLAPAHRAELADALERALDGPDEGWGLRLRWQVRTALLVTGRGRASAVATLPVPRGAAFTVAQDDAANVQEQALAALRAALAGHSRDLAVEAARRAVDAAGPSCPGWPLITAATALALADETDAAMAALDRAARGAGPWTRTLAGTGRALVLHRAGAIAGAEAAVRAAIDDFATAGSEACLTAPRAVLAAVLVDRGESHRAEAVLSGTHRPGAGGTGLEEQLHLLARGRARWAHGDADAALRLLRDCGRVQDEAGVTNPVFAPWWADSCLVLAAVRRSTEGRALAEHGAELAARWGTARALGLAALADGALAPGRTGLDRLAEAVHLLAASPARAEHARAEYSLGRALLLAGDPAGAREHLRTATAVAGGCGALGLAGAARRLLITAGGRMPEIATSAAGLLTGAELRVAGLAVDGASNRQIARTLFVTVRTVESHLTRVYRKLGVTRRDGLATALDGARRGAVRAAEEPPPAG